LVKDLSHPALDNLVRIGNLKAELRNDGEIKRLLVMARTRLADAKVSDISAEGRFTSAYNAAHAAALAALRWHGYRTHWAGRRCNGEYWIALIRSEIWPNTKGFLKLRNRRLPSCVSLSQA
jgi:hypothetical protein